MTYAQFIEEIRRLANEGALLGKAEAADGNRESSRFREWRHAAESIVANALALGFPLPGAFNSASRLYRVNGIGTPAEHRKAFNRDMAASVTELRYLVTQFDKFGAPAGATNGSQAVPTRTGETITRTVPVPETGVLLTTRTGYPLTSDEFDIVLMPDGRTNKLFEASIGAVLAAGLNVLASLYQWADKNPRPDWWADTKTAWVVLVLSIVIMLVSLCTSRAEPSPRSRLVTKITGYFNANT